MIQMISGWRLYAPSHWAGDTGSAVLRGQLHRGSMPRKLHGDRRGLGLQLLAWLQWKCGGWCWLDRREVGQWIEIC